MSYICHFTYVFAAAVAAVADADYFVSKVNQIEGRNANLQKSNNSARDGSCKDAPLSSRIDTYLKSCLPPNDLTHFGVSLPLATYV